MNIYKKYILPKIINFAMNSEVLNKYRSNVASLASGNVLEIGFGPGLNLPYYNNVKKFYAVDPSRELFAFAKTRIDEASFPVEYFPVSAENIPLADSSTDSIVSTWSLCSIPHPEKALAEIKRVLKPGGKFYFVEHGKSPNYFIAIWQRILTPISKCVAGGCNMDRQIESIIRQSGLRVEKIDKILEKTMPLTYMYQGVAVCNKNI